MACPSENRLLDAMEGRLSPVEQGELDLHVAGCDACRELVAASLNMTTTLIDPTDRPREWSAPVRPTLVGMSVGEYVVESVIGSGGMGIVYRGSHPLIGKPVAIKILRPELAADAGHMRRMLSEARAMSAIAHRSIVDVFAFGELPDGRQYMVMEFLQGEPLNQIIRAQAPMQSWTLLPLLDGILEALAASHAAGVIHRDLKPSNLYLVKQTDGTRFVKLLDFGLAKRELDDQGHTRTGRVVMGTPGYMAPEQIRAEAVGPATDLYALGVIAYELATGTRPFRGKNPLELMQRTLDEAPEPPSQRVKDLSPELDRLILSLLAKSPADRPESAQAVRHAVKQLISGEPSRRRTQDSMPVLPAPPRRVPRWLFVAGGTALAAVVVVALAASGFGRAAPSPAPVEVPVQPKAILAEPLPPPPAPIENQQPPEAAAAVAPVKTPSSPRLSQKALLERAAKLKKRLAKTTPRGEEADPMATMLLKNAERDVRAARGDAELKRVEQTLADIERKYFKR